MVVSENTRSSVRRRTSTLVKSIEPTEYDDKTLDEDIDTDGDSSQPLVSVGSSVFALSNTTVGAGTLALPFFFSQTGWLLGLFLLSFFGGCSLFSLHLLVRTKELSKKNSYVDVAEAAFGKIGKTATQICLTLLCIGAVTAYFVIIGSGFTESFFMVGKYHGVELSGKWYLNTWIITGLILATCIFPLTLLKHVSSLSFVNMLGLFAISIVVFMVMGEAFYAWGNGAAVGSMNGVKIAHFGNSFFAAVGSTGMAFVNQPNIFEILDGLKEPTKKRQYSVIYNTIGICTLCYALIGVTGYLRWGNGDANCNVANTNRGVCQDVLQNYDQYKTIYQIALFTFAKISMATSITLSLPMLFFPCRASFHSILCDYVFDEKTAKSNVVFLSETIGLLGLTFIMSQTVPNLFFVFSITGGVTGSMLIYVLPSLFFLQLKRLSKHSQTEIVVTDWKTGKPEIVEAEDETLTSYGCHAMSFLGLGIMITTLITIADENLI